MRIKRKGMMEFYLLTFQVKGVPGLMYHIIQVLRYE